MNDREMFLTLAAVYLGVTLGTFLLVALVPKDKNNTELMHAFYIILYAVFAACLALIILNL